MYLFLFQERTFNSSPNCDDVIVNTFAYGHPGMSNITHTYVPELELTKKLVIQGPHMVSGTRCLAWSDQLKKWSESRAGSLKDRCPVGHRARGEFPDVLRRHNKGLI